MLRTCYTTVYIQRHNPYISIQTHTTIHNRHTSIQPFILNVRRKWIKTRSYFFAFERVIDTYKHTNTPSDCKCISLFFGALLWQRLECENLSGKHSPLTISKQWNRMEWIIAKKERNENHNESTNFVSSWTSSKHKNHFCLFTTNL